MKANEAPEKIYLDKDESWHLTNPNGDSVEYTRTDAFIEKALAFLNGCIPDYINLEHANVDTFMNVDNKRFIEDFKKYMKGG